MKPSINKTITACGLVASCLFSLPSGAQTQSQIKTLTTIFNVNQFSNNYTTDPTPNAPNSGKEACDNTVKGNKQWVSCFTAFNTSSDPLILKVTFINGGEAQQLQPNHYLSEIASFTPYETNVIVTNTKTSKVIYSGLPVNWEGIKCSETECSPWL